MLIKIFIPPLLFFSVGCGVKGMPLAPLKPAPLGDGKPAYSKQKALKKNQIKNKYDYKLEQDADEESEEE